MSLSLYEISVRHYLQMLPAVSTILQKGADFCQSRPLDPEQLLKVRLYPDMLPLRLQIRFVAHQSLGAIEGIRKGEFSPPPPLKDGLTYADMQAMIESAAAELAAMPAEEIDALSGKPVTFKLGDFELPFTAENFVLSFSLPNLHFHATTTYAILRSQGVPLGKTDYLGRMHKSR